MFVTPPTKQVKDAANMFLLAKMHCSGEGVPVDHKRAASLFRGAADRGFTLAKAHLGLLYEAGSGVPQSRADAEELYMSGVRDDCALAKAFLATFLHQSSKRDLARAEKSSKPTERKSANRAAMNKRGRARDLAYQSAYTGNEFGLFAFAIIIEEEDPKLALYLLQRAAEKQHARAIMTLGMYHQYGRLVEKSSTLAMIKYAQAAGLGCADAYFYMARLYEGPEYLKEDMLHKARRGGSLVVQEYDFTNKIGSIAA